MNVGGGRRIDLETCIDDPPIYTSSSPPYSTTVAVTIIVGLTVND
jgi:hypothetical protein